MIAGDELTFTGLTTVHPIGVGALIACSIYLLITSREKVVIPLLILIAVIPNAQRIVLFSVDFSFVRIIILITILRIIMRNENTRIPRSKLDLLIFIWVIWSILAHGYLTSQFSGLLQRTGYMVDVVGGYMIGRVYIRNILDLERVVKFLGFIAIPMAALFLVERTTGKNMFAVFGGVPFDTLIRNDKLRCQGPFSHPIMAGVFWAGVLPWLGVLWFTHRISLQKFTIYIVAILIIVINTASSTPAMAVIFVVMGFMLFKFRQLMPLIRYGAIFLLVCLQLIMEKGVIHLIARVDVVGGSTGWQRYYLMDRAIAHLDEWWAVGTLSTQHWGRGLSDITNQYILEGVRGGLIPMLLFMLIMVMTFMNISKELRAAHSIKDVRLLWGTGIMVFMHAMNFLAVSYFGQMVAVFYLFLGAAISLINNSDRIPQT